MYSTDWKFWYCFTVCHFVSYIPGWNGKLHFCAYYANIIPSTFHHFDPSEPSGNQQDFLDAKKMISKGYFIHQLVTKMEPTWSNSICIAPCPYRTIVRYKSKYFNLRRIILLSIWYQNLFPLRGCEVLQ
jgi:hypothetical protein